MDAGAAMTAAAVDAVTGGGWTAVATATVDTASPAWYEGLSGLFQDLATIPGTWQTLGWMGGMTAIIALLLRLSKTPLVDGLLTKFLGKKVWVRPVIALALGVLGGFFQGLPNGFMAAVIGAIAGLGAGAGAIGSHEAISRMTPTGKAEVEAARALKEAVTAGDAEIGAKVDALKAALDRAAVLPAGKPRLEALAKFANGRV